RWFDGDHLIPCSLRVEDLPAERHAVVVKREPSVDGDVESLELSARRLDDCVVRACEEGDRLRRETGVRGPHEARPTVGERADDPSRERRAEPKNVAGERGGRTGIEFLNEHRRASDRGEDGVTGDGAVRQTTGVVFEDRGTLRAE